MIKQDEKQDEFLEDFQATIGLWCEDMFGEQCAKDPKERGLRLLEEALEAAQAVNVSREDAHKLVDYVFGRPTGELPQEISGVLVTVLALAEAAGISAECSLVDEISRIHEPSFREKIRAKHNTKELAGISLHQVNPESTDTT